MKNMKIAALAAVLSVTAMSSAAVTVLTFEGVGNQAPVGNFYNGGAGGNFGITFSANALGIIDADAGGSGNFGGEPSPSTAMFFLGGNAATMNVAAGFDTGFSFYYTAVNNPGFVTVYDGLNGTGNILATLPLPVTPSQGGDPNGSFSPFFPVGVAFAGIAKSVDFGGAVNQIAFDDITLGAADPRRAPDAGSTVALLGLALVGVGALRRKLA